VREEIKEGAEIIKIFATGGHGVHAPASEWAVSREELTMAIQTAAERGVLVRAHLADRDAILFSIEQGMHIIDHGDGFDDACIEACLRHGAFLAPSLLFPKTMLHVAAGSAFVEGMRASLDAMAAILPRAHAAGVKIILGDDYGAAGLPHGRYAEELALYVNDVGMAPLDVIRWATRNGAEAMNLGEETGTLKAGKLADLLVIDGDPIADICVLQDKSRMLAVFKGGAAIKDDLDRLSSKAGASPALSAMA
jgi:imidazolonepropionase-like amidohydrolase